jgi:hypothetical protein
MDEDYPINIHWMTAWRTLFPEQVILYEMFMIFPVIVEPEVSYRSSQKPTTGPCTEPIQSILHAHIIKLHFIITIIIVLFISWFSIWF